MTSTLIVRPHDGVGPVAFGMTREQVRSGVREAPRASSGVSPDKDHFVDTGLLVHYGTNGNVEAVGLTRNASVSYDGYVLFEHPAHEVRQWARMRHPNLDDSSGFISTVLGLSMLAPLIDEPDLTDEERAEPAQSFLVFPLGYYEDGLRRAASELEAKGNTRAAEILRGQLAKLRG